MTPDRLQRTILGEETDRRPFIPLLNILGARLTGAGIEQYYRDPVLFAAGQREILRRFEPDALFSPLFFAGEGEAWGSSVLFSAGAAPNIRRTAAETPEEFLALPIPDPETNPLLRYFVEGTRLTQEAAGPGLPVGGIVLNPFDLMAVVIGLETWIDTLLFRNDLLPQIFADVSTYFVDFSNALLENGASFIVSSGGVINTAILPRQMVEQSVIPVLRETFSRISAPVIIHNGGGSITPYMDLFRTLPNVAGMVVNEGDDLALARSLAGGDALLVCGLDAPTIHRRSPEEIQRSISMILRNRAGDRRIAIGTTGPDPGCATTNEQVLAMKKAICDTGP